MNDRIKELEERVDKLSFNLTAFRVDREQLEAANVRIQQLEMSLEQLRLTVQTAITEDVGS